MGLNADLVGKSYGESTYEVTADAIENYARATNDTNERYLGDSDVVASPVFPVVPVFQSFMAAAMDPELQADVMRLVHGAEEHVLYAPIKAGDKLTISSELESVETKDSGETFTVKGTVTQPGRHGRRRGARHDVHPRQGWRLEGCAPVRSPSATSSTKRPPRSTTIRPIATPRLPATTTRSITDENVAKMAGLPGIINHGMCTMAIAVKGAVDGLAGGDPTRVKRVGVRFSKPVFPGEEITTRFWEEGSSGDSKTYGFETYNPDGAAVIKNGTVEIA